MFQDRAFLNDVLPVHEYDRRKVTAIFRPPFLIHQGLSRIHVLG
jgi:hypothetical protein